MTKEELRPEEGEPEEDYEDVKVVDPYDHREVILEERKKTALDAVNEMLAKAYDEGRDAALARMHARFPLSREQVTAVDCSDNPYRKGAPSGDTSSD